LASLKSSPHWESEIDPVVAAPFAIQAISSNRPTEHRSSHRNLLLKDPVPGRWVSQGLEQSGLPFVSFVQAVKNISPLPVEPPTAERRVLPGRVRGRSGSARVFALAISCRWWESARDAPAIAEWFAALFQRSSLPAYPTRQQREPSTPVVDQTSVRTVTTSPDIKTLAQLRASGHVQKSVREELRDNLLAALADGTNPWPGLHGFERTVLPQLARALLAGHDIVSFGERGLGLAGLLRTLASLLDEWTPVITGSELHDHPYEPITAESRRMVASDGDDLAVSWLHRDDRYVEKLSSPDTSVADL